MNRQDWQAIEQAKEVLQLGDQASLAEIKQAYHRLSKAHHPDVNVALAGTGGEQMYTITASYDLLMRYCTDYRFPLKRADTSEKGLDPYDPEEWWQARFGEDPLWK